VANGESGALAGEDGTEELYDSPRGDWSTDSDGGRPVVRLRVTAGAGASAAAGASEDDDEGEKEAYLRSLPRPESGRGPATVSSHSWSRRPIPTRAARDWLAPASVPWTYARVSEEIVAQEEGGGDGCCLAASS
jgi:hypothetical protein